MEGLVTEELTKVFRGRRVFVTGHTGFKGSWLALWLGELGAEVAGYALAPEDPAGHFPMAVEGTIANDLRGDVRDTDALTAAVNAWRPEFVFHLAAQSLVRRSYERPRETFEVNVLGTANLLEAVRGCESVRSVVCVTSDKCYRNKEWVWGYREGDELGGGDPYSGSKAAAEMVIRAYRESYLSRPGAPGVASARAGNVIGGGDRAPDRIVPDAVRALERGQPLLLRNPQATRPWQHALDLLRGYLMLAAALQRDSAKYAGAWNFGPMDVGIRTVEALAQRFVARWGEGGVASAPDAEAPHEFTLLALTSDKSSRVLGWRPSLTFDEAVDWTAGWYRDVYDGKAPTGVSRAQLAAYHNRLSSALGG